MLLLLWKTEDGASATIAETQAAQTDEVVATLSPTQGPQPGGSAFGPGWKPVYQEPKPRERSQRPTRHAAIACESPAQTDQCVASVRATCLVDHDAPAQTDHVTVTRHRIARPRAASVLEATPAQSSHVEALALASVTFSESSPAQVDVAAGATAATAALVESMPAMVNTARGTVFRLDQRLARRRDRLDARITGRTAERDVWVANRGLRD